MNINTNQKNALNKANQESRKITRESIREALFQLMAVKSYDNITITELIKRAGVSRSAFYRNYTSKEDILAEEIDVVSNAICILFDSAIYDGWLAVFKAVEENKKKLELILDAGLEEQLLRKFNEFLPSEGNDYIIKAMWNGLIYNLVIEWYKRGMKESAKEIADIAAKATAGIKYTPGKTQEKIRNS